MDEVILVVECWSTDVITGVNEMFVFLHPVVAIGRKSGIVSLHEIEKGTELHKFTLVGREVTVIRWVQWSTPQYVHTTHPYSMYTHPSNTCMDPVVIHFVPSSFQ